MVKKISQSLTPNEVIIDIGGNPSRHLAANRPFIHSCCPLLSPEDAVRNASIVQGALYCLHKVQNCNCIPQDDLNSFIMVHSVYYLTPMDILDLVDRCTSGCVYSMHHTFNQPRGTFAEGEASYTVDEHNNVTMSVNGNSTSYVHPNPLWLNDGYFSDGRRAIAWSTKYKTQDTSIVQFVRAPLGMAPPTRTTVTLPFLSSLSNCDHYGPVDVRPLVKLSGADGKKIDPVFERVSTGQSTLLSSLKFLVLNDVGNGTVLIPKQAINELALQLAFKDRTPELLQIAAHNGKKILQRYNMSADDATLCLPHLVSFAFTKNLPAEIAATTNALSVHSGPILMLRQALKGQFEDFFNISLTKVAIFVVLTMLSSYLYVKFRLRTRTIMQIIGLRREPRVQSMSITWAFAVLQSNHILAGVSLHVRKVLGILLRPLGYYLSVLGRTFTTVCYGGVTLNKTHPTAHHRVDPMLSVCRETRGSTQIGFGIPIRRPTVARSCQHNEQIAVVNRGQLETLNPLNVNIDECWNQLKCFELLRHHELHPQHPTDKLVVPIKPAPFDAWLTRFPMVQRAQLIKAKHRIRNGRVNMEDFAEIKAFVKREHMVKSGPECLEDIDPRLIQGRTPEYQVATGPWTLAFSKYLAKEWGPDNTSGILYSSGLNANQMGAWFDSCIERWKDADFEICEDDCSRWDGSLVPAAIRYELGFYDTYHSPPKRVSQALHCQEKSFGHTPHGVKFSVDGTRKSGDGNTSSGNSLLNAHTHASVIVESYCEQSIDPMANCQSYPHINMEACRNQVPLKDLVDMSILGDDNIMIGHGPTLRHLASSTPNKLCRFGLRPKFKLVNRYTAEYCSGRFWPSTQGTIWGPKIGRVLAKSFYAVQNIPPQEYASWLKAVCLGFVKDVSHIPILRVVVARTLDMLTFVSAKPTSEEHRMHAIAPGQPTGETYIMLNQLYGLTKQQIDDIENAILLNFHTLPFDFDHPLLNQIVEIDCPVEPSARERDLEVSPLQPLSVASINWMPCSIWETLTTKFDINAINMAALNNADLANQLRSLWFWPILTTLCLAPIYEEPIKRLRLKGFPIGFLWLVSTELVGSAASGPTVLRDYILTALPMHFATYRMNVWRGIFHHFIHNLLVALTVVTPSDRWRQYFAFANLAHLVMVISLQ